VIIFVGMSSGAPKGKGKAKTIGLMGEAEVVLRDGSRFRGAIDTFNPRGTSFFVHIAGDGRPVREVLFEQVQSVFFSLRRTTDRERDTSLRPTDRVIQVRFGNGEVLNGVTLTDPGGRQGFFLLPTDHPEVDRVFVPLGAVQEVITKERLGDILEREGLVTAEAVREAVHHQEELRKEKVGSILVRRGVLDQGQLSEGIAAQQKLSDRRLGEILVERGFINQEDLKEALQVQRAQRGRLLGEVMVEMGLATRKMIAIALAIQFNVPFVDLSAQVVDPRLKILVPAELARQNICLPLSVQAGILTLAIPDPTNLRARDFVRQSTGMAIVVVVAPENEITRAIERYYGPPA
jgi:MshEN domain/Family of unknown function (DUF6982)